MKVDKKRGTNFTHKVRPNLKTLSPEHVIPKKRYSIASQNLLRRPSVLDTKHGLPTHAIERVRQQLDTVEEAEEDMSQLSEENELKDEETGSHTLISVIIIIVACLIVAVETIMALQANSKIAEPEPEPVIEPTFFELYFNQMALAAAITLWVVIATFLNQENAVETPEEKESRMIEGMSEELENLLVGNNHAVFVFANLEGSALMEKVAKKHGQYQYVSLYAHCNSDVGAKLQSLMKEAIIPVVKTIEEPFSVFLENIRSQSDMFEFQLQSEHASVVVLADRNEEVEIRSVLPTMLNDENYTYFVM